MRTLAIILIFATPAAAQDVVGEALVDGRVVELLSDGTWRDTEGSSSSCPLVQTPVSVCGIPQAWKPLDALEDGADARFMGTDGILRELLVDRRSGGVRAPLDVLAVLIMFDAAQRLGLSPTDAKLLASEPTVMAGREALSNAYLLPSAVMPVVISDTIVADDEWTLRVRTTDSGTDELTERHAMAHADLRAFVRIDAE